MGRDGHTILRIQDNALDLTHLNGWSFTKLFFKKANRAHPRALKWTMNLVRAQSMPDLQPGSGHWPAPPSCSCLPFRLCTIVSPHPLCAPATVSATGCPEPAACQVPSS